MLKEKIENELHNNRRIALEQKQEAVEAAKKLVETLEEFIDGNLHNSREVKIDHWRLKRHFETLKTFSMLEEVYEDLSDTLSDDLQEGKIEIKK